MSVFDMLNEMSPYLLLGFLIAGIMHAFVPGNLYSKYLSGDSFRSVFNAALLGIPLPLCSCGVIPTAMSLRKDGASRGAASSFLIATPQTGVDSILATYSLMGLPFAIIRPLAALVTALFGGSMVNIFARESENASKNKIELGTSFSIDTAMLKEGTENHGHCCGDDGDDDDHCCCGSHDGKAHSHNPSGFWAKCHEAIDYAFGEMMQDIGKWLIIGIVVAGIISLIPSEYFAIFKDNTFASMLFVLLLAIPMYLCATGSIPIAVALMLKGLTPGAAFVMLMAGPACNIASILVIGKKLGTRTLVTYLASIIISAVAFGCMIDFALPSGWFSVAGMAESMCAEHEDGLFAIICSVILVLLLVRAFTSRKKCCCH